MTKLLYINSGVVQQAIRLETLLAKLPQSMHVKALRYQKREDAFNFALGRLLLKRILLNDCNDTLNDIFFNQFDKPLLPNCYFSISHSCNTVACAFNRAYPIGLDVEKSRVLNKYLFKHCFDEREWQLIESDISMHQFYTYWTMKEAVLKTVGRGLDALKNITTLSESEAIIQLEHSTTAIVGKSIDIDAKDMYAYICSTNKAAIEIENLSEIDLGALIA